ncbi:MAG: hypothetical protein OIF32_06135 [Campylobacterales bacterium]|nr:hypothetical protein [Campylobacterales bacterium]
MDFEKLENDLTRENLTLASTSKRGRAFVIDEVLISFLVIIAYWDRISTATTMNESIAEGKIFL